MNFEQILQEKMQEKSSANTSSLHAQGTFQGGADPAHLAYLIGQIRRTNSAAPSGKYPYRPSVLERKAHAFNELQEQAFQFLRSLIPDLTNAFSQKELKKAFRRAALIVHPDRGGSAEKFLHLKSHYECLQSLVA